MLNALSPPPLCTTAQIAHEPRYDRNEQEDLKLAIDYIYELKKKLNQLHPNVSYLAEHMLQRGR